MNPMRFLILLVVFLALPAFVENGLLVNVELERDDTLRGAPIGLRFIATNQSSAPLRMPKSVFGQITPEGQQSFIVLWGNTHALGARLPKEYDDVIEIGVGQTRTFDWAVDPRLNEPGLFLDERLTSGAYRLQFALTDEVDEDALESATRLSQLTTFAIACVSSINVIQ